MTMLPKRTRRLNRDERCEEAFLKLKELCCNPPVLAYADYANPFKLHADASGLGLGAILYQTQDDGTNRVIAYASRTLSKSEKKLPSLQVRISGT